MTSSRSRWEEAHDDDSDGSESSAASDLESEESEGADDEDRQTEPDDNRFTLGDYQEKFHTMTSVLLEYQSVSTNEWQQQFKEDYAEYLKPQIQARSLATEQKNFLYKIARDGPALPWLVSSLVENHPELLDERNTTGHNALLLATASKQVGFIRSVLGSNINKDNLSTALAASGENGNCIHQAIVNNLDPDVTIQLINAASEETLKTKDRKGLTPLHCAVDYARCTKSRFQVIKALIRCGNQAFDQVGNPPGMFSPYRYHIDTERQYKKAQKRKKEHESSRPGKESKRTREPRHREKTAVDLEGPSAKRSESVSRNVRTESKGNVSGAARHVGGTTTLNTGLSRSRSVRGGAADVADGHGKERELHVEGVDDWERVGYNKHSRESGPRPSGNDASVGAKDKPDPADEMFRPTMIKRVLTAAGSKTKEAGHSAIVLDSGATRASAEGMLPPTPTSGPQGSRKTEMRPPSKTKKSSSKSKSSKSSRTEAPSSEIAKEVAKALKIHYLRSVFWKYADESGLPVPGLMEDAWPQRTHDSAIHFLYADNKDDTQICFDFPPAGRDKPLKIDFEDFKSSYDAFTFDEVLLYVHFGLVELPPPRRPRKRPEGAGRKDMITFFNWLDKKGVRNIVKVIVEDRRDIPHSDEAIVSALKDFSIELLDWRKVDMDPRAIQEACVNSTIRELHLWWSGNNAILRAWSEPDGILKLPHLERVYIHQVQGGLESPDTVNKNVAEFENRLQAGRCSAISTAGDGPDASEKQDLRPIRVVHDRVGDSAAPRQRGRTGEKRAEGRNSLDTHRWLSVVDSFAQGIRTLPPPPVSSSLPPLRSLEDCLTLKELPSELKKEVRVALIDDGADLMYKPISNILEKKGRSFDMAYDDPDRSGAPRPFHGSTTGHGTCMAYMIGRVCPNVKIFVIKLDVVRDGPKAGFTAKSAADAVEFAVERGFDIISMSWTIQRNVEEEKNNTADIARLEDALKAAVDKKKLVFCSAPDIGEASRELLSHYYPFGCAGVSSSIFRIGAAKADGSIYGWAGNPDMVDFILPGHNVEVREEDRVDEEQDTPKTGSSVATALAAGLAALVIHCVRLGAVYNWCNDNAGDPNAVNKDTLVAIKEWDAMKAAFGRISNNDKDCRVEVDNFFREAGLVLGKAYSRDDAKIKWDKVTQLARDLVSSQRQSSVAQAANGA